jgi:hypothetical protein
MNRFTEFELVQKPLGPIAGYWGYPLLPLDQALASVSSQINQLDRSVRDARRFCQYPSKQNLTRDESAAVFLYTMEADENSFYRVLNKVLRDEDRSKSKQWFYYLKLFDTAIEKLPTKKGNLWRGVSGDLSKYYHENDVFFWWSITSCSVSANEAEKFLDQNKDSTLFMIEAINGKDISGYTVYPNEKEIVLPIGTQFRVKGIAKHGKLNVVHLEEIDGNDEDNVSISLGAMSLAPKSSGSTKPSELSTNKSLSIRFFLIEIIK